LLKASWAGHVVLCVGLCLDGFSQRCLCPDTVFEWTASLLAVLRKLATFLLSCYLFLFNVSFYAFLELKRFDYSW
jgi:hypothetical protein